MKIQRSDCKKKKSQRSCQVNCVFLLSCAVDLKRVADSHASREADAQLPGSPITERRRSSAARWCDWNPPRDSLTPLSSPPPTHPPLPTPHPEPKAVEEMKGTDQEYSSALAQYNSSANSGGEDIELLAFQTVTGQRTR